MSWFNTLALDTFEELFEAQIKDLYDAELRLVDAIPNLIDATHSFDLKQALQCHLLETRGQIRRLEEVFQQLNMTPERETCNAMQGLLAEGDEVLSASGDPCVRDAAIIAVAQRVEHYEMAGYGTVRTWAQELGWSTIAALLQATLDEERQADRILTEIAEQTVNARAESV